MILATIDFFNFSDFCLADSIYVPDVICSAFRSIAWLAALKNDFWTPLMNFKFYNYLLVDQLCASK